jgi:uncharacterized protein (TIGR03032 family)
MDVERNEVILKNLAMPHSPRIYDGDLYLLLSATGELVKVDPDRRSYRVIKTIDGFVRGMAKMGDYLFIGLSKLRQNSSSFKHLEIAKKSNRVGISVIHLPTGALVGELMYQTSVDEIYDIQVLPGILRPGILNTINPMYKYGQTIPGDTYWASETTTDQ